MVGIADIVELAVFLEGFQGSQEVSSVAAGEDGVNVGSGATKSGINGVRPAIGLKTAGDFDEVNVGVVLLDPTEAVLSQFPAMRGEVPVEGDNSSAVRGAVSFSSSHWTHSLARAKPAS